MRTRSIRGDTSIQVSMLVQLQFCSAGIYKSLLCFANLDRTAFKPLLESRSATVPAVMQVSGSHEHQGGEYEACYVDHGCIAGGSSDGWSIGSKIARPDWTR